MAVQISLAQVLLDKGVEIHAVAGHSIGEVAAAWVAGALTLEEAVEVVHGRSVIQARAAGGTLLATGLTEAEAEAELRRHPALDLAAVNGPAMTVVAGTPEALRVLQGRLEARGVFARLVNVEVAYHSRWMEPLEEALNERLGHIRGRTAHTPLFSTVTAAWEPGTHLGGDYWYRNVREPVRFRHAVDAMLDEGVTTFLELGPHPVVARGAERTIEARRAEGLVLGTLFRGAPGARGLAVALGALAARGHVLDEARLWGVAPRAVPLPAYAWQRTRFADEAPADRAARRERRTHPWLRRRRALVSSPEHRVFEAHIGLEGSPWLDDHRVDGSAVLPGTAHVELAIAAAREAFGHDRVEVVDVRFEHALVVPERNAAPLEVRLEVRSADGDFALMSRPAGDDTGADDLPWTIHSRGRVRLGRTPEPGPALEDIQARFDGAPAIPVEAFYEAIEAAGLRYGPAFQGVTELRVRPGEILARVALPEGVGRDAVPHIVHPALLDAALHAVFGDVHTVGDADRVYLPHALRSVRLAGRGLRTGWAHVRVRENGPTWLASDTTLYDDRGVEVAHLDGLRCKHIATRGATGVPHRCIEPAWVPAPRSEGVRHPSSATRRILIGEGEVADALFKALERLEAPVERFDPGALGPLGAPVQKGHVESTPLFARDLDRRTQLVVVAEDHAHDVLRVGQILAGTGAIPDVFVIACGEVAGVAAVHAAARVVGNELPRVPVRVVSVGERPTAREIDETVEELVGWRADLHEGEIRFVDGVRERRVLVPTTDEALEVAGAVTMPARGGAWEARVRTPGVLDSVVFEQKPVRALSNRELRIEVHASALNFKDVMNAMGLLSEEAVAGGLSASELGLEVAGVVVEVGASIDDLAPGDRVVARVRRGFTGEAVAQRDHVAPLPASLGFAEGAAIPAAGLTAWYGLVHLARLEAGETVLVHSATGGVGRAAIALARSLGATVIGTAGSSERRAELRRLGVEHVFDSRSVGFREGVLAATGGRGVDVVLNSLTGLLLRESVACLAPFGRFVEIGKSDVYANAALGLRQLGENVSLFVVDVDRLAMARPALHRRGLQEVTRLYGTGVLPPPEVTVLPVARLAEALQTMARSAHTGKLVVETTGEVEVLPARVPQLRSDGTVLVTGGASGLGLVLAGWLVSRGVRHLVLASRSGPKCAADREAVEALRASGVTVELETLDVTHPDAVRALIGRLRTLDRPLMGVVHCAAVLDDRSLRELDATSFERVWAPKAMGARALHEACAEDDLELFLLVSSISSVLGLVGQGAYASANAYLDGLAAARRARGLAGAAVNLGVLGDYAGMSKRTDANAGVLDVLSTQGLEPVRLQPLLRSLDGVLAQGAVQRAIVRLDGRRFLRAHPHLERDARFVELAAESAGDVWASGSHRAMIASFPPEARRDHLVEVLADALGSMLGVDGQTLEPRIPLQDLGLDSLVLTQFRSWMLRELDVAVPMLKLLAGPSLVEVAAELEGRLATDAGGAGESAEAGPALESVLDEPWARPLDPWLVQSLAGEPDAAVTVVCFHSMGVGASLFAPFLQRPPRGVRMVALQSPGREERSHEPTAADVAEIVEAAVSRIRTHVSGPIILWGHSFGGIVAYEVARHLLREGSRDVMHLCVTGTVAPHLVELWQRREVMLRVTVAENSAEYLMALSRHVEDPTFVRAILPLMRRDTPLLMRYAPPPLAPLPIPITAFAARQDDMVYPDEIAPWAAHTSASFHLEEVDGDHWFLSRNRARIVEVLEELAAGLRAEAAA